jgi:nitroimidazol reductase NimA-like FMN-containing flavoprotein (pyridoxamine 5'-phosphate oxidase superfamily)
VSRYADERVRLRRADRTMPGEAEIEALLQRVSVGYVATSVDHQPFIIPTLFWYDAKTKRIYFHTAIEGRTGDNVKRNPRLSFCAAELGRLLPGETASEFSNEYASVCVFGQGRLVQENKEKRYGLQGLLDKHFPDLKPGENYRAIADQELDRTAVYAIEIEAWSGKQKGSEA